MEKGYRVLKIHEVWHFPKDQQKEGLFTPYVNTWLKYKTEASGWPSDCVTEKKKKRVCERFPSKKRNQVRQRSQKPRTETVGETYVEQVIIELKL